MLALPSHMMCFVAVVECLLPQICTPDVHGNHGDLLTSPAHILTFQGGLQVASRVRAKRSEFYEAVPELLAPQGASPTSPPNINFARCFTCLKSGQSFHSLVLCSGFTSAHASQGLFESLLLRWGDTPQSLGALVTDEDKGFITYATTSRVYMPNPSEAPLAYKMQNTFRDTVLFCGIPSIVAPVWAAINDKVGDIRIHRVT
ncbi:hypothetical protein B0H14DRAFT_2645954 [Mycena olivaceomarginata]|nr:hypothetical protein B0H14DRAFT_2645954 [Mycena olivaceomarginata]